MDRLNINNLFPTNKDNIRPLDVNSLYNPKKKKKNDKFSIDGLINDQEEKKKKVLEHYNRIYNMVLKKIKTMNKINNTTEIIYDVVGSIYGCREYNSFDCLNYIEKRLREKYYMDTYKLSEKSIFISWKNIKENREKVNKSKSD